MTEFVRQPQHYYEDPLARVWLVCAQRIGFSVRRSADAYASYDGRGTILIGDDTTLDPDDSLAQMIFHELCHALVQGDAGLRRVDWGLDNITNHDRWREHACLRLQAVLAGAVGLREFFAPTTDFRVSFWADLPADPLSAAEAAGGRAEPSCVAARLAVIRSRRAPWQPHLGDALAASAAIAAVVPRDAAEREPATRPSLWSLPFVAPTMHPAGHAPVADYHAGHGCVDCAWSFPHRGGRRCRHDPKARIPDGAPACTRWESAAELDCQRCGACCREAYDTVEVGAREAVVKRQPEWIIRADGRHKLRREGSRCAALKGGQKPGEAYHCVIYPDRPRTCRDFTLGSANCLDARQRVGLSI